MKALLGQKLGMTRVFDKDGNVVPVTLVQAGPVVVTQVKTVQKDGYSAVQVGFGKRRRVTKPLSGHLKGKGNVRWLREFPLGEASAAQSGDILDVSVFAVGDRVDVRGVSKGKGFAGVVKRHGFRGGWASHGNKHMLRAPGSIGMSWPERVPKGRRMAGRMGAENVTVKNLTVIEIDAEHNILALRGAIPGNAGGLIVVSGKIEKTKKAAK